MIAVLSILLLEVLDISLNFHELLLYFLQPLIHRVCLDEPLFFEVKDAAVGAVAASMVAYLVAQFCDVRIFHWMKRLTQGRHLWLRNNVSTMFSQLVDSTAVILVTYIAAASFLPLNDSEPVWPQLLALIASGYVFKLVVAALDTGPIYLAVRYLRVYLGLSENEEATNL